MSEGDCLQDTQCWVHTELALTKEFMCHLKGFLHWSMTPFMFPTIGKPLPAGNAETVMNPEAKEFQVFSSSHSGPKRQQRTSSWQKINTTSMWTKHCFLLSRNRGLYPWVEYITHCKWSSQETSALGCKEIFLKLRKKLQQSGLCASRGPNYRGLQTTATYDHDLYFYAKCNCHNVLSSRGLI